VPPADDVDLRILEPRLGERASGCIRVSAEARRTRAGGKPTDDRIDRVAERVGLRPVAVMRPPHGPPAACAERPEDRGQTALGLDPVERRRSDGEVERISG
jgi:hypothetical protein